MAANAAHGIRSFAAAATSRAGIVPCRSGPVFRVNVAPRSSLGILPCGSPLIRMAPSGRPLRPGLHLRAPPDRLPAMLSRDLMRDDAATVRERLESRGADLAAFEAWLAGDAERRAGLVEVEEIKRQRNEASRAIGKVKQQGGDATQEIAAVGQLKERIEQLETRLSTLEEELHAAEL